MEMIEVKTAELIGPALDWAVGTSCELAVGVFSGAAYRKDKPGDTYGPGPVWSPTTDWAQAGPLIERFRVEFTPVRDGRIFASLCDSDGIYIGPRTGAYGSRQLVAACRAIVAAKLGNTVSVPKGLMQ